MGKGSQSTKVVQTPAQPSLITSITSLASLLPPSAPLNADLNPLLSLTSTFASIPLSLPQTATPTEREENRQATHAALHALKSTFQVLIKAGRIGGVVKKREVKRLKANEEDEDGREKGKELEIVRKWIGERYQEYLKRLVGVATGHWDERVRLSALSAHLSLLRTESAFLTSLHKKRQAQFATATFRHLVRALLLPNEGEEIGLIREDTIEEWKKVWDRYDDIRYWFLSEVALLITTFQQSSQPIPPQLPKNLLTILETLTTMPTSPSELNEFYCSTPLVIRPSSSKPSSSSNGNGKKRKIDDGSTGIFDDPSSSSSEDEEYSHSKKSMSHLEKKKSLPPLLSLSAHKKVFQEAYLALLSIPLEKNEQKRILIILHRQILPHFNDPKRLMDWLSDILNSPSTSTSTSSDVSPILALNGLFTLITQHSLDYPSFYTLLYSLLTPSLLHTKYRARFFRLLETFLGSSHLSVGLIASFLKRLGRLSLLATPQAGVMVLPVCYGLLKRHVGCMVMIHRPNRSSDEVVAFVGTPPALSFSPSHLFTADPPHTDPYDPNEVDPHKTRALESSLWELATLEKHYSASVNGLSKILREPMNKQSYDLEDFLDHSYSTMFETERTRVVKNAPALGEIPKRQPIGDDFFPASASSVGKAKVVGAEAEGEEEEEREPVDVVARLWSF